MVFDLIANTNLAKMCPFIKYNISKMYAIVNCVYACNIKIISIVWYFIVTHNTILLWNPIITYSPNTPIPYPHTLVGPSTVRCTF